MDGTEPTGPAVDAQVVIDLLTKQIAALHLNLAVATARAEQAEREARHA